MRLGLFGFSVSVDEEATREWYETAGPWDCICGHCRNFLALTKVRGLPPVILETLYWLGIPPEKATYVCELYTDEKGIHYQFSYRLAGRILEGRVLDGSPGRCTHELYPYGAPNFPKPYFDLEFFLSLPWVLEESQ